MYHNVYARIEVPVTDDGATWLATNIEHDLLQDLNPTELEVEALTIMEGDDDGPENREAVEINFVSSEDARSIHDRIEMIFAKHEAFDTVVDVD